MVCRKRSCYDTRNCFIDSLASRRHSSQFVTWPISIFQPDTEKNLPVPRNRRRSLTTPTRRPTDRPTDRRLLPPRPASRRRRSRRSRSAACPPRPRSSPSAAAGPGEGRGSGPACERPSPEGAPGKRGRRRRAGRPRPGR